MSIDQATFNDGGNHQAHTGTEVRAYTLLRNVRSGKLPKFIGDFKVM
jgi:hypothetical protein